MRFVDLSHRIHDGLVTYPGLPPPVISDHLSRAASRAHYGPGTEFHIARVDMVANTGTYLDAPSHRFEGLPDVGQLPLERLAALPGVVVPAPGRVIGPELLEASDVRGRAVLFHTGWDRRFGTPSYGEGHPFLTRSTAETLRDRGAVLVGVDSLNVDDTDDGTRPVHTVLLQAGVLVVEHLTNLAALPRTGFQFFAVPARVGGVGSFPVRAFAIVPSEHAAAVAPGAEPAGGASRADRTARGAARVGCRAAGPGDADEIARIYNQGIEDRSATFETRPRSGEDVAAWFGLPLVVADGPRGLLGWASLSSTSPRACYAGVLELSVYVDRAARQKGVGRALGEAILAAAEGAGAWKVVGKLFPENAASASLVRSLGFGDVGVHRRHARLDGTWRDVLVVEKLVGDGARGVGSPA